MRARPGRRRSAAFWGRAGLRPPSGFPRWAAALAGPLALFFEVNLPSPRGYREWLRNHLDERVPIPYLREMAAARRSRLEGQTHANAMLLAPGTGVAIIFEAKVLSDVATHVTFDMARNQLARTIDVMLEENPQLPDPLRYAEAGADIPGAADPGAHAAIRQCERTRPEQAVRLALARVQKSQQYAAPPAPPAPR